MLKLNFLLSSYYSVFVPTLNRNKTESGWGPNAVFRFPQEGGTGAIWTKVADLLPKDKQKYNMKLISLNPTTKQATFLDGSVIQYNKVWFMAFELFYSLVIISVVILSIPFIRTRNCIFNLFMCSHISC